ncbi:MAG: hypothetical protein E8D47_08745 [Nitrospira sp.]|nr:MAG: hypothetical protein E8D47_08745 [Nitrospira sp.]
MNSPSSEITSRSFCAGDLVEVKSAEEILATLDADGTCEALPFMPEMLGFCGKRFRVFRRATKVCDTIDKTGFRRMQRAVLLDGSRCDGADHGGCQAGCMILWKEQWLKPVFHDLVKIDTVASLHEDAAGAHEKSKAYALLMKSARGVAAVGSSHEIYRCQITELKKASMFLAWWDLRQYLEEVTSKNRRLGEVVVGLFIMLFNAVQKWRGGDVYPYLEQGTLKRTPVHSLNLQPGDKVKVKPANDIQATLDSKYKNRGLMFDVGMARYCNKTFQVATRATKVIHEKTGEMIRTPEDNPMIILDSVICNADYQKFCARSEYVFWREIWLDKVS